MIPNVNPAIAATAVFLCSGLLHEYILMTAALGCGYGYGYGYGSSESSSSDNDNDSSSNKRGANINIRYGFQTMFFLWNAVVLLCEYTLGSTSASTSASSSSSGRYSYHQSFMDRIRMRIRTLPRVVVSLLVVLTVLPIAHLFSDGMLEVPILPHYKLGFPMFVVVG